MLSLKTLERLNHLHISRQSAAQRAAQLATHRINQLEVEIHIKKKEILEIDALRQLAWQKVEKIVSREKMLRIVQSDANLLQSKLNLNVEIEKIIETIKDVQLSKNDALYRVSQAIRKQNSVGYLRKQVKRKLSSKFLAIEEQNVEETLYGRSN